MHISLYIIRRFVWSLSVVTAFVMSVVFLIELVEQFAQWSELSVPRQYIVIQSMLAMVNKFVQFLPLIILLAALFCFFGLARTSEIVVIRASGVPATRFVFYPVIVSGFLGILIITALNPWIVKVNVFKDSFNTQFVQGKEAGMGISSANGMWIRSTQGEEDYIIRLQRIDIDDEQAKRVTAYSIDADFNIREIKSASASFSDGILEFKQPNSVNYSTEIKRSSEESLRLLSNQSLERFFEKFNEPTSIPNRDLPRYIRNLEEDGYDTKLARSHYYGQLSMPIFLMTLCLIGSIFALAPPRFGGIARRALFTLISGFSVYALTRLSQSMGEAGSIPLWISVVAVPIPAFFAALALLLNQEDG